MFVWKEATGPGTCNFINISHAGESEGKHSEISYEYNDDALFCCRLPSHPGKFFYEHYCLTRAAI